MATVHTCDHCKKTIPVAANVVSRSDFSGRFELCDKCTAPIIKILKKYKLTT